jgi:DNA polymerase I
VTSPSPAHTEGNASLYLVDGTSNLFRAFYAIRGLSTRQGLPTNAVYGFTSMLRKLIREHAPEYLGVAFDLSGPTFRHQAFADYKANRPEAPEALVAQIPYAKKVCEVLNVPVLELAGFEADDLIGTLAAKAKAAGFDVVIVASDKDLLQLVGERIRVYNPVKDEFLDSDGVERVFGVRPGQVRDVLALCGDASDNIPGVEGIGEKGAKDLIRRFGSLEATLAAAPTIERRSYREGLLAQADTARLSLDLATIRLDVPVPFDVEAFRVRPADEAAARDLFSSLEFTGLVREAPPPIRAPETAHEVVLASSELERAVADLKDGGVLALNLERDHREPMRAGLVGIALAGARGRRIYVPLGHRGLGAPAQIGRDDALRLVRPLLADPALVRVGHDVKSDLILLARLGVEVGAFSFDTMLASYLLNPSRRSQALEAVAQELAGLRVPSYEEVLGSGSRSVPLAEVGVERAGELACARVGAILALQERLAAGLRDDGLLPMFTDLELPLAGVLADMERAGVRIDVGFLGGLSRSWESELSRLTSEIHALAGREFNINSPRQLGEILFDVQGLRPGRKTEKTKSFSTSVEVLEDLAVDHPLPRAILEYRGLQKLKSTYVDTLPLLVNPETGRVHTSFNQAVAATGRLSSSDPNLQNIPVRTETGRQIRRAFIPADGCVLMSADYSQIELRVLAHLCGDPALLEAFRSGEDIHRRTAAEVFGVLPELVSDEMRRRAKAVNFGILYGMGPQRLARDQGITLKEAASFIERYFGRFPKVKEYIDGTIAAAESDGRVRTLFNRVRYLPELQGSNRNARQQAVRASVNTTIQGTAADLIKMAMIRLAALLRERHSSARMILQVHDELVLEVPGQEAHAVASWLREAMETVYPLAVPLVVDLHTGRNWLDMETPARSKD